MAIFLGIDPGPKSSAYCMIETGPVPAEIVVLDKGKITNEEMAEKCDEWQYYVWREEMKVGIEMIACYGARVGAETFDTCVYIGRLLEMLKMPFREPKLIYRHEVKKHLCPGIKANDATIRAALIKRYGNPGKVKQSGILAGIKADMWAALAVAITLMERGNDK